MVQIKQKEIWVYPTGIILLSLVSNQIVYVDDNTLYPSNVHLPQNRFERAILCNFLNFKEPFSRSDLLNSLSGRLVCVSLLA